MSQFINISAMSLPWFLGELRTGEWHAKCWGMYFYWGSLVIQLLQSSGSDSQNEGQWYQIRGFLYQYSVSVLLLCLEGYWLGWWCIIWYTAGRSWLFRPEVHMSLHKGIIQCLPCLWCVILYYSLPGFIDISLPCRVWRRCCHPYSTKIWSVLERSCICKWIIFWIQW